MNFENFADPNYWDTAHLNKVTRLVISEDGLDVTVGDLPYLSSVTLRTQRPISASCEVFYVEIETVKMGIYSFGYSCSQERNSNAVIGWTKNTYGCHNVGKCYSSSTIGQNYAPSINAGDIFGMCIDFKTHTCFYVINGTPLGIAFKNVPDVVYPSITLLTPGMKILTNFGSNLFRYRGYYEFEDENSKMKPLQSLWKSLLDKTLSIFFKKPKTDEDDEDEDTKHAALIEQYYHPSQLLYFNLNQSQSPSSDFYTDLMCHFGPFSVN